MAYSPEKRAATLATLVANGGNIKKTSRETAIPAATVRLWASEAQKADPISSDSDDVPETIADAAHAAVPSALDKLRAHVESALDIIGPSLLDAVAIDKASLRDRGTVFAMLAEKAALLNGAATSRTEITGDSLGVELDLLFNATPPPSGAEGSEEGDDRFEAFEGLSGGTLSDEERGDGDGD